MSCLPCFSDGMPEADENGYYFACNYADLQENVSTKIQIGSKQLVFFKVKTNKTHVYAMANSCVHQGTPLAGAPVEEVDGKMCVKCPGHGIQYELATGKSVQENGVYVQRIYPVKKKQKEIWVKIK